MNYRVIFEKHYKLFVPNKYDIHHIDLDHTNDDISNLMILPKELHLKYHTCMNAIVGDGTVKKFDAKICGNMANANGYTLELIKRLIDTLEECNKWYDYKLYLDDKISNIHGIRL